MRIIIYGGPRPVEVEGIKVKDIDDRDRIYIRTAKGGNPRFLYMDGSTAYHVSHYIGLAGLRPCDNLFNIKTRRITELIKGLTGYTPRDFRATFGTEIARQTKNPYLVQNRMGHKHISTSMHYVQLAIDYFDAEEVLLYV